MQAIYAVPRAVFGVFHNLSLVPFQLLSAERQVLQPILDGYAGSRSFGEHDEWLFDTILDTVPQRDADDASQSGWLNACRVIVLEAVRAQCLTQRVTDRALARAWSLDNRPEEAIPAAEWISVFEASGYTSDPDEPFERPQASTRVWRGATRERACGLAWTTDVAVARGFASDLHDRGHDGRVWTAVAQPNLVMARYNRSEEAEWVINTGDLEMKEAPEV